MTNIPVPLSGTRSDRSAISIALSQRREITPDERFDAGDRIVTIEVPLAGSFGGRSGAVAFGLRKRRAGSLLAPGCPQLASRVAAATHRAEEIQEHHHVVVDIAYNVYMSTTTPLGRPISVRLPDDLRERVEALAKATRRSQGDVVREVLERDLSELEWEQRIIARAADLRSGRVQTIPLAVVERELGLSDAPVDVSILDEIE